jgi:hypothetical protein
MRDLLVILEEIIAKRLMQKAVAAIKNIAKNFSN